MKILVENLSLFLTVMNRSVVVVQRRDSGVIHFLGFNNLPKLFGVLMVVIRHGCINVGSLSMAKFLLVCGTIQLEDILVSLRLGFFSVCCIIQGACGSLKS